MSYETNIIRTVEGKTMFPTSNPMSILKMALLAMILTVAHIDGSYVLVLRSETGDSKNLGL